MDIKPENVLFEAMSVPTQEEIELHEKLYRQKADRVALKTAKRLLERDEGKLKKKKKKELKNKIAKFQKKIDAHEDLEAPDEVDRTEAFVADLINGLDPDFKPEDGET